MSFGVHSEVGRLRKVMVHRPGLEHTRLTPSNAEELLFDDVLWVEPGQGRARRVLRGRCASAASRCSRPSGCSPRRSPSPSAKEWVSDHILNEREVGISAAAAGPGVGRRRPTPALVADFLIGGITKADVEQDVGLVWESADPTTHAAAAAAQLPVPARPVVLDLRRRHAQPDDQAGPQAGDDDHGGDLPLPPDVRRREVPDLAGRRGRGLGPRATSRAATCSRSATARS